MSPQRMDYYKCRLNAVWMELYPDPAAKAEEPFDVHEMLKIMDKTSKEK